MVKPKLLFVQQHEWDVNGDENYLYASDCFGKSIDNRILAENNEPSPREHFDFVKDADEDHYCMR